ncbi:MAG: hypothetical protein V4498_09235 [candidate division FCPU426 bacterium]
MKRILMASAFALLATGCASPQLSRSPNWEKVSGTIARDAYAGKFHASMARMMDVAQYMFETEGFLFTRRDDDTKTFKTDPFLVDNKGAPQIIGLSLTAGTAGEVNAVWRHLEIIDYVDTDACKGDATCQKRFDADWNWRLFKQLP